MQKRWAMKWDCCKHCGTSELKHMAFGLCYNCYLNEYRQKRRDKKKEKSLPLVYVIQAGNYIKIGTSSTAVLEDRIALLQCGNPLKLKIIVTKIVPAKKDGLRLEKELHIKFEDERANGEWFLLDREDIEYIKYKLGWIEHAED